MSALTATDGMVSAAAEALGVARQTIHQRIQRSPELQAHQTRIAEACLEWAEGAIRSAIKNKDMATVRWFAERKMRHMGYGTRVENSIDTAQLDRIIEAIAACGPAAIRAVRAAINPHV